MVVGQVNLIIVMRKSKTNKIILFGPMSLLPGIAMSMTTVALWTRDMRRTRLLYLTNSPVWFTYDILARSYSCMVIEAIAFVSYVVAVWRFDIKKQPQA